MTPPQRRVRRHARPWHARSLGLAHVDSGVNTQTRASRNFFGCGNLSTRRKARYPIGTGRHVSPGRW
eukprot:6058804-Prymnesium_polylepis.1